MLTKYPHCHLSTPGSRLNGPIQKLISTSTSSFPSAPSTIMSSLSQVHPSLLEFDFPASPGLGTPPPMEPEPPCLGVPARVKTSIRHLIAPKMSIWPAGPASRGPGPAQRPFPALQHPQSLPPSAAPSGHTATAQSPEASLECVGTGWRSGFLQTSPFPTLHCHLCPGLASMTSSLVPSWKACALWS